MLAPVLANGKRAERDVFDAKAVAKKQKGDVDLAQVGRGAKMPWQIDGRKWHLADRVAHNGKPCRWDGAALEAVVDRIEARDGFAAANWNDRSTVEIKGETKAGTWFFHSHTGDEWILKLIVRVPKNTFTQDDLARRLRLTSFDHIDEIPVYGRGDRVRVKNIKGPWQEITVTTHTRDDVATPEFQQFLDDASRAFLGEARRATQNPADLMPWKVLGKKWHLMRKGFPSGKRVHWEAETLEKLFALLEEAFPNAEYDWSNKTQVNITVGQAFQPDPDGRKPSGAQQAPGQAGKPDLRATIHTKRREAIELHLYQPPGATALGRIAGLGESREITPFRDGREVVKLWLKTTAQVEAAGLREFLAAWAEVGDA